MTQMNPPRPAVSPPVTPGVPADAGNAASSAAAAAGTETTSPAQAEPAPEPGGLRRFWRWIRRQNQLSDEYAEQNRAAQRIIYFLLSVSVILFLALPLIQPASLLAVIRVLVMVIAGGLPLILYQSFARGRLQTVFNEYRQNLRRLGYPENATIYQEKFTETYGRSPLTVNDNDPLQIARRFSPLSEVPIVIATLLSILGWISVFYPSDPSAGARLLAPNASPVIYGFLGAYVFGLASLVRQYVADDLQPRYYASLTNRYLVVYVLSWLITLIVPPSGLAEIPQGSTMYLLAAFVAGMFPVEVLRITARKGLDLIGSKDRGLDEMIPLSQLDGLNAWQEDRLSLEGIENLQNMSCANLVDLMLKTRYPVEQLVDWIDQALLFLHTRGLARVFQRSGIRTATDFLDIFLPDDLPVGRRLPSSVSGEQKKQRRLNQASLIKAYLVQSLVDKDIIPDDALGLDENHLQTLLENTAVALINAPNMFHVQYWRQHEYEALPEDVDRMRTSADLKLMQGLPGEAIDIYDATLQRFPNSHATLLYRGLAYFQMGNYARAIEDYQAALREGGQRWQNIKIAYNELGRAFREIEEFEQARQMYEKALQDDEAFSEARMEIAYLQITRLGDHEAAIRYLDRLIKDGFKKAEALSNRGLVRFEQWKLQRQRGEAAPLDRLDEARNDLQQSLRLDPAQVPTYINLAGVQMELKQTAQAIDTLTKAVLQIESQRTALEAGRMAQGSRAARSQSVTENAYRVRLLRGNLYYNQGEYALASEDYQAATRLAPYDAAAYYNLGMAQQHESQRLQKNDPAYTTALNAAIQSFREAVRLKPGHAPSHQVLGDLLSAANRLEEAESALTTALRLTRALSDLPGQALAHYSLGKLYRTNPQRLREARRELDQARQESDALDDELLYTRATFELGLLALAEGVLDQAISFLDNSATLFDVLEQQRDSVKANIQLANALLQAQETERAHQAFTRAADLLNRAYEPGNPEDKALEAQIEAGLNSTRQP